MWLVQDNPLPLLPCQGCLLKGVVGGLNAGLLAGRSLNFGKYVFAPVHTYFLDMPIYMATTDPCADTELSCLKGTEEID